MGSDFDLMLKCYRNIESNVKRVVGAMLNTYIYTDKYQFPIEYLYDEYTTFYMSDLEDTDKCIVKLRYEERFDDIVYEELIEFPESYFSLSADEIGEYEKQNVKDLYETEREHDLAYLTHLSEKLGVSIVEKRCVKSDGDAILAHKYLELNLNNLKDEYGTIHKKFYELLGNDNLDNYKEL